jgi:hypothetical protein
MHLQASAGRPSATSHSAHKIANLRTIATPILSDPEKSLNKPASPGISRYEFSRRRPG